MKTCCSVLSIWAILLFPHFLKGQSLEKQLDSGAAFGRKYKMEKLTVIS